MSESPEQKARRCRHIVIEDALILVSIALLFVLAVFFRRESWAQWALGGVLVTMVIVFLRRSRRTHRAFKGTAGDE